MLKRESKRCLVESTSSNSLKVSPLSSGNISFLNFINSNGKQSTNNSLSVFKDTPHLFSPSSNKENNIHLRFSFHPAYNSNSKSQSSSIKKKLASSITSQQSLSGQSIAMPSLDQIKIDLTKSSKHQSRSSSTQKSLRSTSNLKSSLSSDSQKQNIKVYVRVKPLLKEENNKQFLNICNQKTIRIDDGYYSFDEVFNEESNQESIFKQVGKEICDKLFEGYNGTIFAYGQTGSGKTYTIFGQNKTSHGDGLIYRSINHILEKKRQLSSKAKIKCSMVELYKEDLIDMFAGQKELKLKQTKTSGVYIEGLKEIYIKSEIQMMNLVRQASKTRKVTSTKINEQSSRSHTILSIYLEFQKFTSKLCLIDLAGSQKVRKSEAIGETFEETKKINYSLSCLGNVINALTTRGKTEHIPFRDSKLTRILKDSLSGNFLTSIIVNCSANSYSHQETLSSLKFAERAKKIKLDVQSLNQPDKDTQEIEFLKTVILKLNNDLQTTKKELTKYQEMEKYPRKNKIFEKKINHHLHEQELEVNTNQSESEISARVPIPSERANVQENLKRYGDIKNNLASKSKVSDLNLEGISSLNISKTVHHLGEDGSPNLSSLSYRCDESPDLSLSFSIIGEDTHRKMISN